MFDSLQDRLQSAFKTLRGKGRLSEADIDATAREIRLALLDADVAVPVVRAFVGRIKERASGEEVSAALNPAQQVIKIRPHHPERMHREQERTLTRGFTVPVHNGASGSIPSPL